MLALSWLYCAVALFGERRRALLGLVLRLGLLPDLVELLLGDDTVTDRSDCAGGDLGLAATRQQHRRHDEGEQSHTHDELLHRFSLPRIDDWS